MTDMTIKAAKRAFVVQRLTSKRRGIPFQLSFEEWWNWWQTDSRWERRGKFGEDLVMARIGDDGPYSLGNICAVTSRQNIKDGWKARTGAVETTPMFSFRLSAELQEALKRAAEADDRTPSALARKIITDWLKRQQKSRR